MCGIVGTVNLTKFTPILKENISQMLAMLRHRGPDEFGIFLDENAGLGSARLSIIDLGGGQQPIPNEDETLWIVLNGEIFNYVELRPMLEARGHRFRTDTDTEVILHLYEEFGADCLQHLNGQFAIAIWDTKTESLFLARDRVGIHPLFYTVTEGALIFGSEIKSLLADNRVSAEIDPVALGQVFTYWSPQTPRSIFKNIVLLPPGHFMRVQRGRMTVEPYWTLDFPDAAETQTVRRPLADAVEELRALLVDATKIRLRADVPVGAYLSGGLDSSVITAIIRNYTQNRLDTFSITFTDPDFDESEFQFQMADFLGTDHQTVRADYRDIGETFPTVIWHTETPVVRTAPVPMYLLSRLVREHNFKVVLTGEGSDEFFGGYNIFKEAKVRRFWAKQPDSEMRPLLLRRLYPYIKSLSAGSGAYLKSFFREGLTATDTPGYSHAIRWRNTARARRFFAEDIRAAMAENGVPVALPADFHRWGYLQQAQYLEVTTFMAPYLLSSQGDRMAMANSVEGRFPFLDHRVIEFAAKLPDTFKLHRLNEKYIVKKMAEQWIPPEIWRRTKRPYRAPIHRSFFNEQSPLYVREMLSPENIAATGMFKPAAVSQLVKKIERGLPIGETDDMALAGILSTQLVHRQFIADFQMPPPLTAQDNVKICYSRRRERR